MQTQMGYQFSLHLLLQQNRGKDYYLFWVGVCRTSAVIAPSLSGNRWFYAELRALASHISSIQLNEICLFNCSCAIT